MSRPNWTDAQWFAFDDKCHEEYGRYYCRTCAQNGVMRSAHERYCMGVYAAMQCDRCWDANDMNHDRAFDPKDAGEAFSEDDY